MDALVELISHRGFVMLTNFIRFTFLMTCVLSAAVVHADMYGSLSPADQATVDSGGQVVPTPEAVPGSNWPKVTVYQRVEATPDQVAAVMFDYSLHKTMFAPALDSNGKISKPGITKSNPAKPGSADTDIDYTMVFPKVLGVGIPAEDYSVNDVLSTSGPGNYQITWTFLHATSMKNTTGTVAFEPRGTGTLIGYTNFISPPLPSLAKLIVKMYVNQVKDTVTALVNQTVSERNSDQDRLNAQLAALNQALGQ